MSRARPLERLLQGALPLRHDPARAAIGPEESIAPVAPALRPARVPARSSSGVAYKSTEVAGDYKTFPLSTNGKVFGTTEDGKSYVCSGTAVSSDNMSVVWTAAHCVYATFPGTGWASRLTFVPAYKDGRAPFGEWPMTRAWVPGAWVERRSLSYDIAAIVVSPKRNGDRLIELTGGRGIQWNVPRVQLFESFGYPAKEPFNGQRMVTCKSPYLGDGEADGGPAPVSMACDMTAGSSGGGWIIDGQYLNSNTSHGYTNRPGVLFGPYFDNVAGELYETASSFHLRVQATSHSMTLSLSITKRFKARGRLYAQDGYAACGAGATVGIYRKRQSRFVRVKVVSTDAGGHYAARLRRRPGTYRAFARARIVDGEKCSAATSPVRRIR